MGHQSKLKEAYVALYSKVEQHFVFCLFFCFVLFVCLFVCFNQTPRFCLIRNKWVAKMVLSCCYLGVEMFFVIHLRSGQSVSLEIAPCTRVLLRSENNVMVLFYT